MCCFVGCTYKEIISHLNIDDGQCKGLAQWNIAATYPYTDEGGKLLYEIVRFTPKKFRPRRPDPDNPGGWLWNLTGVGRVLYRLPEVLEAAKQGEIIWIVEGEKDADRLVKAGLCATTWPDGAKSKGLKWNRNYSESLGGARVAVIPDNDAAGIATARIICNALAGVYENVRLVNLPDVGAKEDVSDFLDKHGKTIEDLKALYDAAPDWTVTDERESDAISNDRNIENRLTELGTAKLLKEHFGEDVKHHSGLGYLVWDGRRWEPSKKAACRLVHKLGDIIRETAKDTKDPTPVGKIYTHAKAIERSQGAKAILEQARSLEGIDADAVEFDNHPLLLNCLNGVVDVRTGKLLEHRRDLHLTKLLPTRFNPDAECSRYMQTPNEVFSGMKNSSIIGNGSWAGHSPATQLINVFSFSTAAEAMAKQHSCRVQRNPRPRLRARDKSRGPP